MQSETELIQHVIHDRFNFASKQRWLSHQVVPSLQPDILNQIKSGCERNIRPDLSASENLVLDKVKHMMKTIAKCSPIIKTLFCGTDYAGFLEGTIAEYSVIHIFGCCPVSDTLMYPPNISQKLHFLLGQEISYVSTTELSKYTDHDPRLSPPFIVEKFQIEYKDGITLQISYFEVYSIQFLFENNWWNMFFMFSAGYFCTLNKVGLLLAKNNFILYRKQYISQSESIFHKLRNFGNAFGLGFLCFNSLPS